MLTAAKAQKHLGIDFCVELHYTGAVLQSKGASYGPRDSNQSGAVTETRYLKQWT
jgi:hypothetical protein